MQQLVCLTYTAPLLCSATISGVLLPDSDQSNTQILYIHRYQYTIFRGLCDNVTITKSDIENGGFHIKAFKPHAYKQI